MSRLGLRDGISARMFADLTPGQRPQGAALLERCVARLRAPFGIRGLATTR